MVMSHDTNFHLLWLQNVISGLASVSKSRQRFFFSNKSNSVAKSMQDFPASVHLCTSAKHEQDQTKFFSLFQSTLIIFYECTYFSKNSKKWAWIPSGSLETATKVKRRRNPPVMDTWQKIKGQAHENISWEPQLLWLHKNWNTFLFVTLLRCYFW